MIRSNLSVFLREFDLGAERITVIGKTKIFEEIIIWEEEKACRLIMLESNKKIFQELGEIIYLKKIDDTTTEVLYNGSYTPRGMAKLMTKI